MSRPNRYEEVISDLQAYLNGDEEEGKNVSDVFIYTSSNIALTVPKQTCSQSLPEKKRGLSRTFFITRSVIN